MARPNNPTFNKSNQYSGSVGYHSRTLFVFNQNYSVGSDWTGDNKFNGIEDLVNSVPNYCHGSYILPPYYWRDGKTIRISGYVRASNDDGVGGEPFNIRFGIKESGSVDITWLGIQNNNNNHQFIVNNIGIPISFENTIACCTVGTNYYFTSNGYYEYNGDSNVLSSNTDTHYIPVYTNTYTGVAVNAGCYTASCAIAMSFYDSNLVPAAGTGINLCYLLIEELA